MSEDYLAQQQPTLKWNPARSVWETIGTESLLCEHLEPFLQTWPTSGLMRNGQVFELPMQEHRTTDSASSSLPTPAANEPRFTVQPVDKDGNPTSNPNERWYHPETGRLMQKGISQALNEGLLRTPAASEGERGHQPASKAKARGGQQTLTGQFMEMFPTPNTMDHLPARTPEQKAKNKGKGGYSNVRETVVNDLMPTPTAQAAKHGSTPDTGSNTPLGANLWDLPHVLPTPGTGDGTSGSLRTADERKAQGHQVMLNHAVNDLAPKNLPTPSARDYKDGTAEHERKGKVQTDTVARAVFNSGEVQLPTPTASDWKVANHSGSGSASSRGMATVVEQTNWGKFEPAIKRWEQTIGRPAPAPTKPDGKDGNYRLSSKFTEWMMGLPDGWITDVGLKRNDELKACGNGVVPQQAELALRMLLDGHEVELKEDSPR